MVDLPPRARIGLPQQVTRATASGGLLRGRLWLPPLVSGALVGWLVWRVSPRALLEAAARLDLAAATGTPAAGELFRQRCERCHGADGTGGRLRGVTAGTGFAPPSTAFGCSLQGE
jgi:mono/diheme cytochrome c family protein